MFQKTVHACALPAADFVPYNANPTLFYRARAVRYWSEHRPGSCTITYHLRCRLSSVRLCAELAHVRAGAAQPVPRVRLTIRGVLAATVRQEGALGLYRGIGPTLCGILPYAGLKFYVYQSLKQQYRRCVFAPHCSNWGLRRR